MDVKLAAVVALAACSGSKAKIVDDARGTHHGDAVATPRDAAVPIDPNAKGDVQIRVEWKDVPAAARAEPGRTPCGTPRAPAVAPTTTWGIPDVFVALDATTSPRPATAPARVVLADCALSPRALVASQTVLLASAAEGPTKLAWQRVGQLPLGGAAKEDKPRDVYLPAAGHEVEVALEPGAIYRVGAGEELAYVVASDSPFVAITEANGNVVLRSVPAGPHAITAWLPPRSGQPARVAHGSVTVAASALTEVTLDITKP